MYVRPSTTLSELKKQLSLFFTSFLYRGVMYYKRKGLVIGRRAAKTYLFLIPVLLPGALAYMLDWRVVFDTFFSLGEIQ